MEGRIYENLHRINRLGSEMTGLYHQAALKLGMSDSVMAILYMLFEQKGDCLLHDISLHTGISKQTIHSALGKLEKQELVKIASVTGKTKRVFLTEAGQAHCQKTILPLTEAECAVFASWTEEELRQYLYLMEKYNAGFKRQISTL